MGDFPPSTTRYKKDVVSLLAFLYPPHFFDLAFTTQFFFSHSLIQ